MADTRSLKHRAANATLRLFERCGVHVLPTHFYSPVAHRGILSRTEPIWRRELSQVPFDWDVDTQAAWLKDTAGDYPAELTIAQVYSETEAVGPFRYGLIEAQMLYSWLRKNHPEHVVEIGSGSSTAIMSLASRRNEDDGVPATQITAIDPYQAPNVAGLPHVTARATGAEVVRDEVLELGAGDLLFIDSTHALRTGSELAHLYLELLPQLASGVVVHIHDIYLPYLFSPDFYDTVFDWQETTLVAALLAGNDGFEVLAAMSGVFHDRSDALHTAFPEFRPRPMVDGLYTGTEGHFPSSLWLRKR